MKLLILNKFSLSALYEMYMENSIENKDTVAWVLKVKTLCFIDKFFWVVKSALWMR